jgi:hypothetical protein
MPEKWLKVDNGTRYPGLVLEVRDSLPKEWGSRAAFRWIRAEVTEQQIAEIRMWKLLLSDNAWTAEQLSQFEKNRIVHESFRVKVRDEIDRRSLQEPEKPIAAIITEVGRDLEAVGQLDYQKDGGLIEPEKLVDIGAHLMPSPKLVWKPEPIDPESEGLEAIR